MNARTLLTAVNVAVLGLAASTAASAQVNFDRVGYRLTSIGERVTVNARVGSRSAASRLRFNIADTSIATVNPSGVVVARRPGYTRLWAAAGKDSSSVLILVDQWAAKFEFYPAVVRLDAVGSMARLRVNARDAAGYLIPDRARRPGACRSINDRIATLAPTGDLRARSSGVTYVRCTDRGIADSVRVEVRPRAARVQIADERLNENKTVADTFRLRVAAFDHAGDEIRDVQATWASLNPSIMRVDPLTGMARAAGAGIARIVAQVGDATDTLTVNVQPNPNMPTVVAEAAPAPEVLRIPTLALQSLYLMVGDTGRVSVVAKDASGNTVANPLITYRSNDTSIVRPVAMRGGQGWIARTTGTTYIVAQFGMIVDSLQVSVRPKGSAAPTLTGAARAIVFERPRFDTLTLKRVYAERRDSAARAMRRQSIVKEKTGRTLALSAVAGPAAHSTHTTKSYTEGRTGLMYGGNAELAPFGWFKATGDLRAGELRTNRNTGEDMKVTEAEAQVIFSPATWLGFGGGYVIRNEVTELGTQRWTFPRVSATARFAFVGDAVTTVAGFSVLPAAHYTGYADSTLKLVQPNPFSIAGEAGIEVRNGLLSAGLNYYVERFTFPILAGVVRRDQFSALRLRLGLQVGR